MMTIICPDEHIMLSSCPDNAHLMRVNARFRPKGNFYQFFFNTLLFFQARHHSPNQIIKVLIILFMKAR